MALLDAKLEPAVYAGKGTSAEAKTPAALSIKNVLFATDFSPTSEAALPYAASICRRFGATLHAAHVISDAGLMAMTGGVDYVNIENLYTDVQNDAKKRLEQISQRLEGISHRCYVRHGQVWNTLATLVEWNEIDLLVLGTHGRKGLGKLLLGSVAEDILRHAPCPVLTIGPSVSGRAKLPALTNLGRDLAPVDLDVKQIVFATNFASGSEGVARAGVSLAEEFRARLTLLHVIEDYVELGRRPAPIEDGVHRLLALIPATASLPYLPETLVEFGPAAECILKVAADREADMVVLGARSSSAVGTHLPWTTTHEVLVHAPCPVLTVRG
jgi:nucleotide-binding universal stress UspA family protein